MATNADEFPKGSRVRICPDQLESWIGRSDRKKIDWQARVGTVTGMGRSSMGHGPTRYVRWDGQKSSRAMAPEWLELVEPAPMSPAEMMKEIERLRTENAALVAELAGARSKANELERGAT